MKNEKKKDHSYSCCFDISGNESNYDDDDDDDSNYKDDDKNDEDNESAANDADDIFRV